MSFTENTDDITKNIIDSQASLVFFAGYYPQAIPIIERVRETNSVIEFFGSDGLDSPELRNQVGSAVDNMYYTSVAAATTMTQEAKNVAKRYQERYDEPAPPFYAESYDTAKLCIEAVARAANNKQAIPTRAEVLEQMQNFIIKETKESKETFSGISGNYRFTSYGDPFKARYFIKKVLPGAQWSDNKDVLVQDIEPPR